MTTGTATTTVSAVMLSDLWGDARSARKARLAVGALIVAAVAIGMTAPAMDASGIAFVLGLSVAILGLAGVDAAAASARDDSRRARRDQSRGFGRCRFRRTWRRRCSGIPADRGGRRYRTSAAAVCVSRRGDRVRIAARRCAHRWLIPDACARVRCPSGRADRRAGSASARRARRAGRAPARGVATRNGRAGTRSRA